MEQEVVQILNMLRLGKIEMADFNEFLHARHAKERNAEMLKRNPNQAELDQKIREAKEALAVAKERNADMRRRNPNQAELLENTTYQGTEEEISRLYDRIRRLENTEAWQGTEEERHMLSGMSDEQADEILAQWQEKRPALAKELGNRIDAIAQRTREYMVSYGLETQKAVDAMNSQFQHYVPLQRDMEESELLDVRGNGSGKGVGNVRGSRIKQATGSLRKVEDIFTNLVKQREEIIQRGEKNRVGQAFYGLVLSAPQSDFWAVATPKTTPENLRKMLARAGVSDADIAALTQGITTQILDKETGISKTVINKHLASLPNVVSMRLDGEDRIVILNRKNDAAMRLAQDMRDEIPKWMVTSPVFDAIGQVTRYMASINTQYNPVFGLTNLTRDIQECLLNLASTELYDKQAEVLKGIPIAIGTVYQVERGNKSVNPEWAAYYREFLESGAATGYADNYQTIEDRARALEREMFQKGFRNQKGVKQVLDLLSDYNTAVENGTRLSVFVAARKNGFSTMRAAVLAKEITVNFNKKGASTGMMSSLFAFFNAGVQGTWRMGRTLNSKYGRRIIVGGIALGVLQATLGILAMGSDDWDKDIPEFEKAKNTIIPNPFIKGHYFKLPMPLGFSFLPNIGRILTEMVWYQNRIGERAGNLVLACMEAVNPLDNKLGTMWIPTPFKPVVELKSNEDAFGRSIYRKDYSSLDPTPGHTRAKEGTALWWKGMAQAANFATGGNDYRPGAWSPEPEIFSYIFSVATGGVGREGEKLAATVSAAVTGDKIPAHKKFLISRFSGEANGESAIRSRYYEALREMNIAENEAIGFFKEGKRVDRKTATLAVRAKMARKIDREIRDIQKAARQTNNREIRLKMDAHVLELQQKVADLTRVD